MGTRSDLIYSDIGAVALPHVIRALSGAHTITLYAHTKGRFEHLDMLFIETCQVRVLLRSRCTLGQPALSLAQASLR